MALAANDEAAMRRRGRGAQSDRRSHQPILAARPGPGTDAQPAPARSEAPRFEEAEALLGDLKRDEPNLALGAVLEGRLKEKQHQIEPALQAYERALDLGAGSTALAPLIARCWSASIATTTWRGSARRSRPCPPDWSGSPRSRRCGRATRPAPNKLAAQMVQGDPQGVDVRLWQAQVLNALGKTEQAEEVLTLLAANSPTAPTPWLRS